MTRSTHEARRALRVLLVSNRYPTEIAPNSGTFVPALRQALERAGLCVELLHIDRHGGGRRAYLRAFPSIRKAVGAFDPHIVHVLWGGFLAWMTVFAIRDRPVVLTFSGTDLLGLYMTRREGPVSHASRLIAVTASRLAARRASHVILVSRSLVPALPRNVASTRYSVISSGIDTTLFRPLEKSACRRQLGWSLQRKQMLFPSSARRPEKRCFLARETLAVLGRRGHDVELHELEGVPHHNVPIWMNAADVLLLTSHHEGSARAMKEALACGRPIVSVDVGDAHEILGSLENCRISEPTSASLADRISEVWNSEGHSQQARERMQHYSWNRTASEVERVYRLCLSRAPIKRTELRSPDARP